MDTIDKLQAMLTSPSRYRGDKAPGPRDFLDHAPEVFCVDGFHMSVQTGWTHYCQPRLNEGPWSSVEVGFPSERVEEFMPYIDGKDSDPTNTVYGYVPLAIVAEVVDRHGGLKQEAA